MEKKIVKRYWYMDLRDYKDYVTTAYSVKHLKIKVGTSKIKINGIYRRKNEKLSDLILLY